MENFKSVKVEKTRIVNLDKGKLPPQAIELEEAILGSMLQLKTGLDDAMAVFNTPDVFYKDQHRCVFQAMLSLYSAGNPVDMLTVSSELRKLGLLEQAGGDFYLIQLTQKVASSAHTDYHCRIVLQKYIARMIIAFSSTIIGLAYDETTDVFDLISRWQKEFDKVADLTSTGRGTATYSALLNELKYSVERLSKNTDDVQLVGIDTGFQRTNRYTGGYRKQDLVIVGGRPGMGKTAKVVKTAVANVKKGIPVGFISGEMSAEQLVARSVAVDTNFHLNQLMKSGFSKPEYFTTLQRHIDRMKEYPLIIDDTGRMDINDVVILAKQWVRKHGIQLLIIDYLQLMKDRNLKGKNRNDELSEISRRLKMLAKELDIPVIALAQVNRDCEKRGANKRPMISDIKDCGSIEQDADIVEFLYRPEYYKLELDVEDYEAGVRDKMAHLISMGANAEVIYAKYRGGATNTTLLKWIGDKTKYVDVEDENDMHDSRHYEDAIDAPALPAKSASAAFGDQPASKDEPESDIPF